MPLSNDFKRRLFPILPDLAEHFGTPFHIYDEKGIRETGERLKRVFVWVLNFTGGQGFREYFAVKALPNPAILKIMNEMGFGFDCSSTPELTLANAGNLRNRSIMFTSNNTTEYEFRMAVASQGDCIINLDDVSLIQKLASVNGGKLPLSICFRYNPGPRRTGNAIIGDPKQAKYGLTHKQLLPAYRRAKDLGATSFGLHTMVCSNERNYRYMVETVRSLLQIAAMLKDKAEIILNFINMGGGIGIPYRSADKPFELEALGKALERLYEVFFAEHGYAPHLAMESGRFMTGPHGALVARAINRKDTYQKYIGVDTGMPALMRPAMYGAYHEISVVGSSGKNKSKHSPFERVHIVGSICENCDRLTPVGKPRLLPKINVGEQDGDFIVTHDTGAHGSAMGFNYNGRLRPQELLLRPDGTAERIRRAETIDDLFATLTFGPRRLDTTKH